MRLYGIGREIATTILAFILNYFQKRTLNKFLINFTKYQQRKKIFSHKFGAFLLKFGQKSIFVERRVLNIPIIYHHVKNQKKLMSLRKMLEQMDGQTDSGDFIGPSTT